jgi:hypothetical protein
MKQLLSLFLFLLPCLAWAQYPSNGNQKITLGEQTTADGLIWRGVIGDTALITPLSDTSAYIILDTVNNKFYNYKRNTNVWTLAGGGDGITSVAALTLGTTGTDLSSTVANSTTTPVITLNVPNASATARGVVSTGTQVFAGQKTFNSPIYGQTAIFGAEFLSNETSKVGFSFAENFGAITAFGTTTTYPGFKFTLSLSNGAPFTPFLINNAGDITFNNLQGSGDRTVIANANGLLSAPLSSINTKENVQKLNYGLNELLQINPVSFDYINKERWGDGRKLGFIVEDMFPVIPEVTGTMNNGDMYLDMTKLIPVLTKAIQEQQVQIEALKQRLLNLENK